MELNLWISTSKVERAQFKSGSQCFSWRTTSGGGSSW
jgi:hypothetical protein